MMMVMMMVVVMVMMVMMMVMMVMVMVMMVMMVMVMMEQYYNKQQSSYSRIWKLDKFILFTHIGRAGQNKTMITAGNHLCHKYISPCVIHS